LGSYFPSYQKVFAADVEDRFYGRGVCSRAHEVTGRSAAEEQTDGLDEDRFARTGFAGQNIEARPEFDLDLIDDREASYSQEAEHKDVSGTGA
jgi:hypothetical protein